MCYFRLTNGALRLGWFDYATFCRLMERLIRLSVVKHSILHLCALSIHWLILRIRMVFSYLSYLSQVHTTDFSFIISLLFYIFSRHKVSFLRRIPGIYRKKLGHKEHQPHLSVLTQKTRKEMKTILCYS